MNLGHNSWLGHVESGVRRFRRTRFPALSPPAPGVGDRRRQRGSKTWGTGAYLIKKRISRADERGVRMRFPTTRSRRLILAAIAWSVLLLVASTLAMAMAVPSAPVRSPPGVRNASESS